ncbi:hypothetical protein N2152v2_004289 [Parachlorella kessleri]
MKTLRKTCVLLAVCLAVSVCTSRVGAEADDVAGAADKTAGAARPGQFFVRLQKLDNYYREVAVLVLMAVYVANIVYGRAVNERLAIAWTAEIVKSGGVLDRNFSLLGPGDTNAGEVLLKESMHEFKLWASGRRYCQSLLATFILKKRQDLLGLSLDFFAGSRDVMDIEIAVNEGSMPPIVLAIAAPSVARQLVKHMDDIEASAHRGAVGGYGVPLQAGLNYSAHTKRMEVDRARLPAWPQKGVSVLAEHSSIFYDLLAPPLVDLLFGQAAWAAVQPLFRSLHVTSDFPSACGPHKQVIRLSFYLPAVVDADAVQRFFTAATVLIDLVGTYKLSPEQTRRAVEARARAEKKAKSDESREEEEEKQRRAEERRKKKFEEEKERLKRMTPEQRARYEEKKRMKQFKSQFRVKTM